MRGWLLLLCVAGCGDIGDCPEGEPSCIGSGDAGEQPRSCSNGDLDREESDVDCGGGGCSLCREGRRCRQTYHCAESLVCEDELCSVAESCQRIARERNDEEDGIHPIDPDGEGGSARFDVYCDMTTDGGGWTLMATLATTDTMVSTAAWGAWSDDWFVTNHGQPTDPTAAFSNHDARKFRPLVAGADFVLRATNPNNEVRRFHRGFTLANWDLWNAGRDAGAIVVGPFNLSNVVVSQRLDFSGAVVARSNGHWTDGGFYLGTAPQAVDADSEGIGARYHVGAATASFGYAGDARASTTWNLWVR